MLINDEAQKQVLPILARSTQVPSTEVSQRLVSQLGLNPGQQIKAEIIANLPNHLYLARIAGEVFKLEIPINVQPGQTMEMTFVSAEPRFTFQVRPEGGGASVALSSLGRWLAGVVGSAPELPELQGTLLEHPEQGAHLLADRLKGALTQGGLFYESHLAQWAAGSLPLADLLKEPQGKLSRVRREGGKPGPEGEEGGIAAEATLPLIREQLQLINSGVLSWKGEAWPDQVMELAIRREPAEVGDGAVEASLDLELPHLGELRARISLGHDGVKVELVCQRGGAAQRLKQGADELGAALAARGLHLAGMVARDEQDER